MARILTKEAKQEILGDAALYIELCEMLSVKPNTLNQLIYRNSPRLKYHDVVLRIATALKMKPDEILEEETVIDNPVKVAKTKVKKPVVKA